MKNGPRSLFSFRDTKAQTSMRSKKRKKWAKNRLSPKTSISLERLLLDESDWILAQW